jgi:hypothetical protein
MMTIFSKLRALWQASRAASAGVWARCSLVMAELSLGPAGTGPPKDSPGVWTAPEGYLAALRAQTDLPVTTEETRRATPSTLKSWLFFPPTKTTGMGRPSSSPSNPAFLASYLQGKREWDK